MRSSLLPIIVVAAVAIGAIAWVATQKGGGSSGLVQPFSGENALKHVEELVKRGKRIPGSPEAEAARQYMENHLKALGWQVKRETFTDNTPTGDMEFVNLRARFAASGSSDSTLDWASGAGMVLLCSHYDTKIMEAINFIGANDGGSSTGVLLEIGRILKDAPDLASGVELVFFDGEEAVIDFTAVDGLYGSRHYAKQWRAAPAGQKPEAAILLDLVGDNALRIDPPSDSPRSLLMEVYKAAEQVGERQRFGLHPTPITDDHVPLNQAGIPAIDLIDADYISRGRWHSEGDDLQSVSAASLEIIGRTVIQVLENRASND